MTTTTATARLLVGGGEIIRFLGGFVLGDEIRHDRLGLVEFPETVREGGFLLVLLQEGVTFAEQDVLRHDPSEELNKTKKWCPSALPHTHTPSAPLPPPPPSSSSRLQRKNPPPPRVSQKSVTYRGNAGVIRQHETADSMRHRHVGRFLGQRHLNARRTPGDKGGQTSFPDP